MAALRTEVARFLKEISALEALISELEGLPPAHQKLIAELIIIKLAVGLENCLSQGFYRLASGQADLKGDLLVRHSHPSTIAAAKSELLAGCRNSPWLNTSDTCKCLEKVVVASDPILSRIRRHGNTVSSIRKIRNHVAHKNRNSSTKFGDVVRQVYGARLNSISPGTLLLTKRAGSRPLCQQLIIGARVATIEIFRVPNS